jgi:uncharacterized protein
MGRARPEIRVISVARISLTPVKSFRLNHPGEVLLGADGVAGNRLFVLVGADGERLRSSKTPWPVVVSAEYDSASDALAMTFPGGAEVSGSAAPTGEVLECELGKRAQRVALVPGPWDELLSKLAGRPVRLARVEREGAAMVEPVTIVSLASVARVSQAAGVDSIDSRRFRTLFELDGAAEHEEDAWAGRRVRLGEAVIEVGDPVIRCAVTTRDPESGERDLDTLGLIASYRGRGEDGEIFFARYARVAEPGVVRVGDEVEAL